MYVLASLDIKFKTNKLRIEDIFQHYGFRKIQNNLYLGELDIDERKHIAEKIDELIRKNDSVLIIPLCQSCYVKKENCGREIKFKNDLYRVY